MVAIRLPSGIEDRMRRKITKRLVDTIDVNKRDVVIWDTEVTGFGLRCRVSGVRYYMVKYRLAGRSRWYTIGRHGAPWTPIIARKEARRVLGEVAAGSDPAKSREEQRHGVTIQALCDRFLADYVPDYCKPSTAREYQRSVELFIVPALKNHRIQDILRADIAKLHHDMHSVQR